MRATVLVPLGADAARHAAELDDIAAATGSSVAYLQLGSPSLADELDRLAAAGETRVELVGLGLGAPTARSWLGRVAGHWCRSHPEDVWYGGVDASCARRIVREHLVAGDPVVERRLPRALGENRA